MNLLPEMAVGDTPKDQWTLELPDKSPQPLDGVTLENFTVHLHNEKTGQTREGKGEIEVVNAAAGIITYRWDAEDTAVAGVFRISVQVNFPNGQQLTFGIINRPTQKIVDP